MLGLSILLDGKKTANLFPRMVLHKLHASVYVSSSILCCANLTSQVLHVTNGCRCQIIILVQRSLYMLTLMHVFTKRSHR